jgi:hypothetical protein
VAHSSLQVLSGFLLNLLVVGLPAPTHAGGCHALLRQNRSPLYSHGVVFSNLHPDAVVKANR